MWNPPRAQRQYDLPFELGALYSRSVDIHGRYGGQRQGGIATPSQAPFVILFTGEAGLRHGYHDFWDDDGLLHYYGEGQAGDMKLQRGNSAIQFHASDGKRLLLFQAMGHGRPYRFLGELVWERTYIEPGVPDSQGVPRNALVFVLRPVDLEFEPFIPANYGNDQASVELDATTTLRLQDVRTHQSLFKRRLVDTEKRCRLTGIDDLRFLRASHIRPWGACSTGTQRVDGQNGLLLSPDADLLFDRGWITFGDDGQVMKASELPERVVDAMGLDLHKSVGKFGGRQIEYLEYHRNKVFECGFTTLKNPVEELVRSLG